ncbi:hypothetical protein KPL71_021504 [Citrus sinensis]|uniref:Uncharacterized protein n=1 Tax=Citrus sinensis TaxID=2711 RepID=A0ACB8JFX6_CITSI|nr:hypothetical protein KPL71_021504 [Citrus sinensis]
MDNLQDLGNLDPHGPLQPVNVQEEQNGHINQRQPGNNNIIYMTDDRDRAIRDYTVLTTQVVYPEIVRPKVEAANFELKPVMFQMLQTVGQFNGLPSKDLHLHLKLFLELETFYNGLNLSTRLMVDALANGALLSKSYTEAYEILERIANNNYQWLLTRQTVARGAAGVHNIDAITALSTQVTSLTNMVKVMTTGFAAVKQVAELSCVYCGDEHVFDKCPRNPTSVNYIGNFNRQPQNNRYSSTYNPGWKQHPNFSWSNQNQHVPAPSGQNRHAPPSFHQQNQRQRHSNHNQFSSLETLIKEYIVKNEAIVQSQAVSLRNLKNQIGQLATTMSSKSQGRLPSNTEDSRKEGKEHCRVINLKSGKNIDIPVDVAKKRLELNSSQEHPQVERELQQPSYQDTSVSSQATTTLEGNHSIPVEEDIATPVDLGRFTIPCSIGTMYNGKALCDLGASINLMSLSVFKQLRIGECRPTIVTLQFVDRSYTYSEGKIEDVLVKVDKFIFPVDFIVLDFEVDKKVPIILGRPFLATGKTMIDVQKRELTMRVNDQQVTFNVLETMKSPDKAKYYNCMSVVDLAVTERINRYCSKEVIEVVTFESFEEEDVAAVPKN